MTNGPETMRSGDGDHDELRQLAELAPMMVLATDEQRALAAHLAAGCLECDRLVEGGIEAVEILALATPLVAPEPASKARLLSGAGPAGPGVVPRRARRGRAVRGIALAAGLLLVVLAGAGLLGEVDDRNLQIAALGDRLGALEEAVDAITAPSAHPVALHGEDLYADAVVRAWLDPVEGRIALAADALPRVPADRTYQLWAVTGEGPRDLGVFAADAEGSVLVVIRMQIASMEGVVLAVSVEPAGGMPAPSGPIVFVSR